MTIGDIARELQVSKSTVSRALSGKGRIGEATRQRILAFAGENNFIYCQRPKAASARSWNIGVAVPADAYTTNVPFFQECLMGISEAVLLKQFHVLLTTGITNDLTDIRALVENKRVDGMILLRSVEDDQILKYLVEKQFPTGLVGMCEDNEVIQVDTNNCEAAEHLVSMLIGRGCRRFALVVGNIAHKVNRDRCTGFERALEKHAIPKDQQITYTNCVNTAFADNIVSDLISRKVQCIVCADDVICTILMSRLHTEGYRIPGDISIASLYNSSNLDCFSPSVTAVNVSARQVGIMMGKQMTNYLMGNDYNKKTIVDYELLFRNSTMMTYWDGA